MKLLRGISLIIIICSVLYLVVGCVLKFTDLSYRTWADFGGKITIVWILPLLGIIWLGVWLKKKSILKPIVRVILMIVSLCAYLGCAYLGFFGILFTTEEDRMLTSNLIATVRGGFPDEPHYTYNRPVTVFFKTPCEVTLEDKTVFLEEKYNKEFEIKGKEIYSIDFPAVKVTVDLSGMEFEDDYVEGVLAECLSCGIEELGIEREYYVSEGTGNRTGIFFIQLKEEADIPDFATDTSKLITYVCEKTDLFEEYRGYFYFYCGEGTKELKGLIPFGKLGKWDEMDSDYYLHPESMKDYIQEKYEVSAEYQKKQEEDQKRYDALTNNDAEAEKLDEPQAEIQEFADEREVSAKMIYDKVLAMQGYSYELCYNAKGNLYLNLGSGPAEDESDTESYRFTLVYDRKSKNGACDLFVLYKEHYVENADGTKLNDATAILDMYAVETGTGKVVAADKQRWSDVGTDEYRELTGE